MFSRRGGGWAAPGCRARLPRPRRIRPAILLWSVIGFAFYELGFAAAVPWSRRHEDVPSDTLPFSVFLVGGLLLVKATIASPDAVWIRLLSYLRR